MVKIARGLGRGLDSLFQIERMEDESTQHEDSVMEIAIGELRPNPYQPRKTFNEKALEELKQSIVENGIVQPLIVRESAIKGYEIIAGERRFRAAKLANQMTVPVIIRDFEDAQMMEVALLENLQREDLTPLEEAEAYYHIMDRLHYTQEMIADRMGKSRSHIANYLRLLTMPASMKDLVANGKVSFGHAKVLLGIKDQDEMNKWAKRVAAEELSVRELEKLITKPIKNESVAKENNSQLTRYEVNYIEEQTEFLREKLGTKVTIQAKENKGKIEIKFVSIEDLERVMDIINRI